MNPGEARIVLNAEVSIRKIQEGTQGAKRWKNHSLLGGQ